MRRSSRAQHDLDAESCRDARRIARGRRPRARRGDVPASDARVAAATPEVTEMGGAGFGSGDLGEQVICRRGATRQPVGGGARLRGSAVAHGPRRIPRAERGPGGGPVRVDHRLLALRARARAGALAARRRGAVRHRRGTAVDRRRARPARARAGRRRAAAGCGGRYMAPLPVHGRDGRRRAAARPDAGDRRAVPRAPARRASGAVSGASRRAVFLDRDGTLIEDPGYSRRSARCGCSRR